MLPSIHPAFYREYRTAKGWRRFIYFAAPLLSLFFLLITWVVWRKTQYSGLSLIFLGLPLGLVVFFLFCVLETHQARFIITANSLTYVGFLRRKVLPLANLAGYRTDPNYTYFISRHPADPRIKIGHTSEDYAAMQQWFADRFPNLEHLLQEKETAAVLTNRQLGASFEDRLATVARTHQTARYLNGAGVAVAAWLLLHPQPYRWAVAAGLALPLLVAAALWRHRGILRLAERRHHAYPSVLLALVLPLLALAWRAAFEEAELVSCAGFWCWASAVAVGLALLLLGSRYVGKHQRLYQSDFVITTVICAFLFGSSATALFNRVFDDNSPTVYTARVLGKETSSSQITTYYLQLSSWGPRPTADIVTVPRRYYDRKQVGDSVHLYLRPGRLQMPWFEVKE